MLNSHHPQHCIRRFVSNRLLPAVLSLSLATMYAATADAGPPGKYFRRVSTFPVFLNSDVDNETVSEIVDAADDGNVLVYTDAALEVIGFIDISDPSSPQPDGTIAMPGEPTSVAVKGIYALAAVNTSADYVNTSGVLQVIHIPSRTVVESIDLGGQPDSIAINHNGRYACVAIENERNEDLGSGEPPQAPPGFVVIVDMVGPPANWSTRIVDLVGVPDLFPEDPEPEFVDINSRNIAAVTLQENNHLVLIDLPSGDVIADWSCGTVDLDEIDTTEEGLITYDASLSDVPREPDGVSWIGNFSLATADEGDLYGGSRGFTVFDDDGNIQFTSGNGVENVAKMIGHYPEDRSGNKGAEPEGVEYAEFGKDEFLFIGTERSSFVLVFRLEEGAEPQFVQVLPAGLGPEGLLAIPERNLFVATGENDSRDDGYRGTVTVYELVNGPPTYPTVFSTDREDGHPIPWGALSALAADPTDPTKAYTAYDSFYIHSRIFELDVTATPAIITDEIVLTDDGSTVDLDVEGVAVRAGGGFWVVSEGAGSVDDPQRPVTSLDLLLEVDADGTILQTIELPAATNALQHRFGFEGVAAVGEEGEEFVYVAFQREWVGDPDDHVRIGRYDTLLDDWKFFHYPIDEPTSPNGGWVGLSELVAVDDENFLVIERDNQAGTDARIKQIATFSIAGLTPEPEGGVFPVVEKVVLRDLIPDLLSDNGPVIEKVEGMTVTADGDVLIVTDNDGVDDSTGETQLQNLGPLW